MIVEKLTREQAEAVQRMQDAIEAHLEAPLTLDQLATAAGYSGFHASRLFREVVGISPSTYLRARRLAHAALMLRDSKRPVNAVAVEVAFESHEGFTRAFTRQFGITPDRYRTEAPPLALFTPRSAWHVYQFNHAREDHAMTANTPTPVFVHLVERPTRRLIMQRGKQATDYWAYCEELGCDVWGTLCSLKDTLGEPMGLWLPESLRKPGTSEYVMGVEVPLDYAGPIPSEMDCIELPSVKYLVFQGQPYRDEEMGEAIGNVWKSIEAYNPAPIGYAWADDLAPRYQLAPIAERGYIEGRPVLALPN